MRLPGIPLALLLFVPLPASAQAGIQQLLDRAEIEAVVVAYGAALDTLDADGYAGVFTEDAELEVAGTLYHGRAEIRGIVEGLVRSRDANQESGTPGPELYHVISNTAIEILGPDAARHRSYWQTVRAGPDNQVTVGAMGRYEDAFVKKDGHWRIASRRIVPFGD